ncbi:hypothetical protein K431DRAFT_346857 [Polychaeton citri CBS 116435]|uniref:Mid2 domain-containing protein n=1 Tax=Polychaeton citri CBS 116435 TaxID=1314669 RepID=A0A9P4UQ73_9PEZI|nr:hypothetical protein K431DRAFT_346857 [Polychaeton citri CBS 116435]
MLLFDRQMLLLSFILGAGCANARVLNTRSGNINYAALDKRASTFTTSAPAAPISPLTIETTATTTFDLSKREPETASLNVKIRDIVESVVSVIDGSVDGASSAQANPTITSVTTINSRRSPSSSSTDTAQNALDVLISAVSEELLGSETSSQTSTRIRSISSTKTKSTSEQVNTSTGPRPTTSSTRPSRPTDTSRPTDRPSDRPSESPGRPSQTSLPPAPPPSTTMSTSTSNSASPVAAASSSSTNALPPPPDPAEQDRKGRVAGIATGAIAGAAIFALAGAFLVRRHLQKKASAGEKKGVYPEVAWLYDPAPTPSRPGSAHSGRSRNSSIASASEAPLSLGGFDAAAERRASAAPEVIPSMVDRHASERQSRSTWPSGHDNSSVPLLAPIPAIASRETSPVGRSASPGGSPSSRYSRRASRSRSSLDVSRRPLSAVFEEPMRPMSHIDR